MDGLVRDNIVWLLHYRFHRGNLLPCRHPLQLAKQPVMARNALQPDQSQPFAALLFGFYESSSENAVAYKGFWIERDPDNPLWVWVWLLSSTRMVKTCFFGAAHRADIGRSSTDNHSRDRNSLPYRGYQRCDPKCAGGHHRICHLLNHKERFS